MPVSFTHPMLPVMKVVPQPPVADTDEPVAPKADKGAPDVKTEEFELRPTVGHTGVTPVAFDKTRTADASGDGIDIKSAVRMLDAPRISSKADTTPSTSADPTNHVTVAEAKDTKTEVRAADPIAAAKPVEATPSEEKSKQTEAAAKPDGESAKPDDTDPPAAKAEQPVEAKADAAKPEARAVPVKVAETAGETKPGPAPTEAKPTPKADAPKDQTRVLPVTKQPKRREGQIAVFISRKDSKLYVRQNFAPLFDVPVTITPSDRPFGTHVFTAELDKNDPNILHWSVVTVPSRAATREQPRAIRTKKGKLLAPPVEAKPTPAVDTAAEALDRIKIPADAMARIVEALTTGGSIIVSDQGINQGDTGEGTDFIVSVR
jgi:hypothetical protein